MFKKCLNVLSNNASFIAHLKACAYGLKTSKLIYGGLQS
jgi:hypothetical protein